MIKKILTSTSIFLLFASVYTNCAVLSASWWPVQSVDTVKYSRDLAREKLQDVSFDTIIYQDVRAIADLGATHIAIATPYDEEFDPYLKRWVAAARANGLSVWFRGNFAGWEGWFDYPKISREQHLQKTKEFILRNKALFEDGDIFTPCPECENGGPGDPRQTGDVEGFRKFMIDEYKVTKDLFRQIKKNVKSNFNSMNGDVALLVMDKATTRALEGLVTIDHYVETPEKLVKDIKNLARSSGGTVVLGEFGAPIPDIHGVMTEVEQASWVGRALKMLINMPEVYGVNYWTSMESSTNLWDGDGTPRKVVEELRHVYSPKMVIGQVLNELGDPISYAKVRMDEKVYVSDEKGRFEALYLDDFPIFTVSADGYKDDTFIPSKEINAQHQVVLTQIHEGLWFKVRKFFDLLIRSLQSHSS